MFPSLSATFLKMGVSKAYKFLKKKKVVMTTKLQPRGMPSGVRLIMHSLGDLTPTPSKMGLKPKAKKDP